MSEIFDEIVEATQSKDLIDCIRERAKTVKNEDYKKDILECLKDASELIKNEMAYTCL